MRRVLHLVLPVMLGIAACVLDTSAVAQPQRSSPGAYLPYKSESVKALVQQMSENPTATERFARHFGMSPDAVKKYFAENLTLTTLKRPHKTVVYYVTYKGTIRSDVRTLRAGTRVFAAFDGTPILDWRCSNPLTTRLPVRKVVTKVKPAPPKVATPVVEVKPMPPIEIIQPQLTAVATVVETVPSPILATVPAEVTALPSISLPPVLLATVPALFGAFALKNDTPPPAVPEPGSLMGLGCGTGLMALQAFRFRKRKGSRE